MNNEDPNNLNDEKKTTEQKFDKAKQTAKSVGKFVFRHWKLVLIVALIVVVMLIIFVGASYLIVLIDGTEDSSSSSNVPASASSYTDSVSANEDGELTIDSTVQEVWDELVENGSDIGDYLDSAEELAKLINAELITQNVDTREDPDEEITDEDWEEIISEMAGESSEDENSDEENEDTDEDTVTNVQGIIKFKRATADDDGNYEESTTMTYVDIETFYDWIEIYNETGSEEAKENLMTHFTLETETTSTSSSSSDRYNVTLNYSESDQWTDISAQIVKAAFQVSSPGSGLCQSWVRQVYAQAGLGQGYYATAYIAYKANCVSTSTENIPVGAAVYGTGSASNSCGHVGIYLGDIDGDGTGEVIENLSGNIEINDLDYWISWQTNAGASIPGEAAGWLGWGWQSSEPTRILSEEETEEAIQSIAGTYTNGTISYSGSSSSSSSSSSSDSSSSSTSSDTEETEDESETETKTYAIVATWNETDYKETTNDTERTEEAEENSYYTYSVSTTKIDYKNLTSGYTMPFNYLWEFLVITENKEFVMALADLVYDSEIEITIYDNETVNTNIETITYEIERETVTSVDTVNYNWNIYASSIDTTEYSAYNGTCSVGSYDDYNVNGATTDSDEYWYKYTTVTTTNTLNVELTKANVWMADYEIEEITSTKTEGDENLSEETDLDDEIIADEEEYNDADFTYGQDNITAIKSDARTDAMAKVEDTQSEYIQALEDAEYTTRVGVTYNSMSGIKHIYSEKHINRSTQTSDKTDTTKFTLSPMTVTEKTDKNSEEPNFVTLFIEYRGARSSTQELWSWLMEIMEANEDTVDLIDLTKYLVYKATGKDYGVTEFDFESLYGSAYESLTSVGSDYVVNTEMSDSSIVITDLETLKTAFSGYSGSSQLIEYAQTFLDLQEEYNVNAVFAAAVSISETSGGRAGHATDGKKNWFNISCTCGNSSHGRFETYSSVTTSIEAFYKLIANGSYYFTQGNYTVSTIGMIYCEDADADGGWIETTIGYMTQMFNAAGITITSSGGAQTTEYWESLGYESNSIGVSCPRYYQSGKSWSSVTLSCTSGTKTISSYRMWNLCSRDGSVRVNSEMR